jgi:hypothetical protein
MLADLALGVQECPIDASIFRLSRFSDGQLVTSSYGYSILG